MLHAIVMAAAILAAATTLFLEARFQWMRHAVLTAEPERLERLGRHIIVGYRNAAELQNLLDRHAVSGIFVAAHNVGGGADVVRRKIQALQEARARQHLPPLWIATDQEGGMVSRLSPPLPRSESLSDIVARHPDERERSAAVRQFAASQGRALSDLGINLNFAPVVDLNHNVVNPNDRHSRIHARAIAADPDLVTEVARHYCSALWQNRVRCTLKHFPGLGRVFEDTHRDSADLTASPSDLAAADWIPFRALMQNDDVVTMIGHARLVAVDADHPASASRAVVGGLIRRDWRHDGILVTDDFCMGAVSGSRDGIGPASVAALNAGVDLVLVSYDPDQYYPVMFALLEADRTGRLQREQLEASDKRLRRASGKPL
jgi:beta-N-acetylhexosaminidase